MSLAYRMRPRSLEEFIGQTAIVGPGTPLLQELKENRLKSMIFYGPAGCGKTSLAEVIAASSQAAFETLSAVTVGVKEVRDVIARAKERLKYGQKTVLFLDEVHRFNKSQQDVLLPAIEAGTVIFIGATTENPFFNLNTPLLSRCRLYVFSPLNEEELILIVERALKDEERGLGGLNLKINTKVKAKIAQAAGGDARRALALLELAAEQAGSDKNITETIIERLVSGPILTYDKKGDFHYDVVSAFIKSLRGSDVDAALFWLAKMVQSGEDPRFIARRLIIFASEDIGNADPQALVVATAAAQAVDFVGLPECALNLAQAVIYLALAPKSNAVIKALKAAMTDVRNYPNVAVPKHLKDSHYPGAKKLGAGVGYLYPHNFPKGQVKQDYLPKELKGKRYYTFTRKI